MTKLSALDESIGSLFLLVAALASTIGAAVAAHAGNAVLLLYGISIGALSVYWLGQALYAVYTRVAERTGRLG